MQINIGVGPDFRLVRGQELLSYKFEIRHSTQYPLAGARILNHRSLAMIAREILREQHQLEAKFNFATMKIREEIDRIKFVSYEKAPIFEIVILGPRDLTSAQTSITIKNLVNLWRNLGLSQK